VEPFGVILRPMKVESRTVTVAPLVLILLALTGCSSAGIQRGNVTSQPRSSVNSGVDAAALCRTIAGSPTAVIGVTPSTVGSIRAFQSGAPTIPPQFPLANIWPGALSTETAAWCQVKSGTWYRFLAVTSGRAPIELAETDQPMPGGGYPPVLV